MLEVISLPPPAPGEAGNDPGEAAAAAASSESANSSPLRRTGGFKLLRQFSVWSTLPLAPKATASLRPVLQVNDSGLLGAWVESDDSDDEADKGRPSASDSSPPAAAPLAGRRESRGGGGGGTATLRLTLRDSVDLGPMSTSGADLSRRLRQLLPLSRENREDRPAAAGK